MKEKTAISKKRKREDEEGYIAKQAKKRYTISKDARGTVSLNRKKDTEDTTDKLENEPGYWDSVKAFSGHYTLEVCGSAGQEIGNAGGNVLDVCSVFLIKVVHIAILDVVYDKYDFDIMNTGAAWALGKCGEFIGKGIGVAVGFCVASTAYLFDVEFEREEDNDIKSNAKKRIDTIYHSPKFSSSSENLSSLRSIPRLTQKSGSGDVFIKQRLVPVNDKAKSYEPQKPFGISHN